LTPVPPTALVTAPVLRAYLELLRPANVVTALGDVLAGFAVAGLQDRAALPWLLTSTACLYAGGVVLNDFFDRDLDRVERPERPIPSGRVSSAHVAMLGTALLAAGVVSAFQGTRSAGLIASAIAAAVLLYDAWGKKHAAIAPVNMGLCRALNLCLGMAAMPEALASTWPLASIPWLYIGAVTTVSRGEVYGGRRQSATVALFLLVVACVALLAVAVRSGAHRPYAVALAIAFAWKTIPPFWRARQSLSPEDVRTAVKNGILMLVALDATIGAGYAGPVWAILIVAVGFLAGWLARLFAVT
jgi:4-hydroxybenzoate polyprenyltransferase